MRREIQRKDRQEEGVKQVKIVKSEAVVPVVSLHKIG
jgi:hypothetical protein